VVDTSIVCCDVSGGNIDVITMGVGFWTVDDVVGNADDVTVDSEVVGSVARVEVDLYFM